MVHLIVQASKYLMILLFLAYTFECFHVFRYKDSPGEQKHIYRIQKVLLYVIHLDAYLVLYLTTDNVQMIGFYLMQVVLITAIFTVYHRFYKKASVLVLNNMCMLLCIGLIILTRISFDKAFRQFVFLIAGAVIAMLIPVILQNLSLFRKLTWLYAGVGVAALAIVAVAGTESYGANLSVKIAGIAVQPSEFVKIIFVFFIASMLYQVNNFRQVVLTSAVSAAFVLMLVASKDLGGALLYFVAYLVMIYVATRKPAYFIGGLAALSVAAVIGYRLFSHVQTRVTAWKDPLSTIDKEGYQVSQSLFGIGTGGWFGLGLNQGMPGKIPVVEKDFIFSAISEEMGGIFALCLIMVCLSCFFMIINIAMRMTDPFYKLVALGLGTLYAMQVFLTIGGVTKFIPSTGVTLPLVSYGGSSLLSTMIVFGVIQGLYMMPERPEGRTPSMKQKEPAKKSKKGTGGKNGSKKQKTNWNTKIEDLS